MVAAKQQLLHKLMAEVPAAAASGNGGSNGNGGTANGTAADVGAPAESGLARHLRWGPRGGLACGACRVGCS